MRIIINYKIIEMIGAVCGVGGAVLVSLNIPQSKYGFVLFLVSRYCFLAKKNAIFTNNASGIFRN
jgi:nicotinamide riboside transporter PnuC